MFMKSILIICAMASSFMPSNKNESGKTELSKKTVSYYWFNTSGAYLRQNTLNDEGWLTGYNNVPSDPKTLQENGYNPVNCTGSPPVPIEPDFPDERLYSHP